MRAHNLYGILFQRGGRREGVFSPSVYPCWSSQPWLQVALCLLKGIPPWSLLLEQWFLLHTLWRATFAISKRATCLLCVPWEWVLNWWITECMSLWIIHAWIYTFLKRQHVMVACTQCNWSLFYGILAWRCVSVCVCQQRPCKKESDPSFAVDTSYKSIRRVSSL